LRLTTLAAFLPLLLAAAPSIVTPVLAATPQVLHRPSEAEPETLDPQKTTSDEPIAITRDMFTGLLTLDNHRHPIPGVAESWDVSPDGKIWIFHLRHGLKWSNGDKLTAEDFVYSFRRLADPATAASDTSDLDQVENALAIIAGTEKDLTKLGVTAIDPVTLRLTLIQPRPALKFLLTDPTLFPLHKATIEKWGKDWVQPAHIVSNGPFHMKAWTPQSDIVLEKNPNFYDADTVKLTEVHWLDSEDPEAELRRYRAGELDFVGLTRNNLPWAKREMADQLHTAAGDSIRFLFFNMTKGPLSQDLRLREAINLAVDRETEVTKVDPRGQEPAYSLVSPLVSDYTPQTMAFKDMSMPDRLARAKELLTAAGYGPENPLKLTVSYMTDPISRANLLAIGQMLSRVGVALTLDNMEWQVLVSRTNQRDFELGYMSAEGPYDDFESALGNYWTGSGTFNFAGYSSKEFDAPYEQVMVELDPAKRRALAEQAERVLVHDFPFAPLEFGIHNRLVNPKLEGLADEITYPQSRYMYFKDSAS
jgi:oligopeptide transport system substrate-binding protein